MKTKVLSLTAHRARDSSNGVLFPLSHDFFFLLSIVKTVRCRVVFIIKKNQTANQKNPKERKKTPPKQQKQQKTNKKGKRKKKKTTQPYCRNSLCHPFDSFSSMQRCNSSVSLENSKKSSSTAPPHTACSLSANAEYLIPEPLQGKRRHLNKAPTNEKRGKLCGGVLNLNSSVNFIHGPGQVRRLH